MGDVGERVPFLEGGQRTARPVVALALLRERHPQLGLGQGLEADLRPPEEARRDHGVEEAGETEAEVPLQGRDVVVRAVEDLGHAGVGHDRREGGEVVHGERIDEARVAPVRRELDEADLLDVVMQAVGLGVQRQRAGAGERLAQPRQLFDRPYPTGQRPLLSLAFASCQSASISSRLDSAGERPRSASRSST